MNPFSSPLSKAVSRREMLRLSSCGFGWLAFAGLAARQAAAAPADPLLPRAPHFPARAKRVIFLFMQGGPSHVDLFDYKPQLARDHGLLLLGDAEKAEADKRGKPRHLVRPLWDFKQHGQSGMWVSSLFPHIATQVDKLCMLHSLHTDPPDHPQAVQMIHTGTFQAVRPSIGAWMLYGLGTESEQLPGFVALRPVSADAQGSAFLPAAFQPTRIGERAEPITLQSFPNLTNAQCDAAQQRAQLDFVHSLNADRAARDGGANPEFEAVAQSYERAFRMQAAMPGLMDIDKESAATRELYGIGEKETDEFGRRCLLARRLAESGVRFIELAHNNPGGGTGWDQHKDIAKFHPINCRQVDKPIAGLLTDLAARGLLEDTLVLWGGEFGRSPWAQDSGRDHNPTGFTMWMAGGGVKPGLVDGATDEHGIKAIENRIHIHDLHATLLHLMGLDHERLTYRYAGRDFRLTDVFGNVVKEILA